MARVRVCMIWSRLWSSHVTLTVVAIPLADIIHAVLGLHVGSPDLSSLNYLSFFIFEQITNTIK